jgi:AcrR family transcriptional regulator
MAPSPLSRSEPRPAAEQPGRREELLDVGLRMFSSRSFDELSMDEVAAEAGVAKGLLYYYFGSKRGLYVATLRAAAAELREQWDSDPALSAAERLADGLDAYLAHAEERAEGYRTLLAGGIGTDPEVRAILAEERGLVVRRIVESLGEREPRPALRTSLHGWLSFMEGATLDWLDARDLERGQLRELLLAALAGALGAAHAVDRAVPATFSGDQAAR